MFMIKCFIVWHNDKETNTHPGPGKQTSNERQTSTKYVEAQNKKTAKYPRFACFAQDLLRKQNKYIFSIKTACINIIIRLKDMNMCFSLDNE